jgi:putative inorganic carbon (hco3(-)) transporter
MTILVFLAVVTVALVVGFAYTSIGFWAILGGLAAAGASVFLFSSPRALAITVFIAKPLIDMLWFAGVDVAGVAVNASSVLSVVIVIAVLVFVAMRKVDVQRGLLAPMLAVLFMNVWALVMTPDLAYGVQYMIRVVCGFPMVFVVPAIVDQLPSPRRLLQAFFLVMAFVCLTVILQPLGALPYKSFDEGYGRATGFYYHPWDVARYMVILIPLLLAILDEPRRERLLSDLPYWGLLLSALVVTYFTFLKAAWLAVLFQLLLWLVLTGRRNLALGCLVATIAVVAFPLRSGFVSVFSDLWKLSDAATRGEALSGRVFLWGEYWSGLRSSGLGQILLGQGYVPNGWSTTGAAVHDDYLRLLVMTGIAGLLAYVALMVAAVAALSRSVAQLAKQRGLEWRIGLAVQCLLAAYFLMGITADPSSYPSLTIYLWLMIGLVIGYAQVAAKESEHEFTPDALPAARQLRERTTL